MLFFANVFRRTWLLPGLGVGLLVLSAILIGGVYPAIVQQFQVKPNEPDQEAPYIQRNIEATRTAYGIDDVDVQDYAAQDRRDGQASCATTPTPRPASGCSTRTSCSPDLPAAPADPRPTTTSPTTLDVDRYTVDGERAGHGHRPCASSNLSGLPPSSATGSTTTPSTPTGTASSPRWATSANADGPPGRSSASDIPPQGELGRVRAADLLRRGVADVLDRRRARGRRAGELDYPDDATATGQSNTTYTGEGGVAIGSTVPQAAVRQQVPGGATSCSRTGSTPSRGSSTTASPRSASRRSRPG